MLTLHLTTGLIVNFLQNPVHSSSKHAAINTNFAQESSNKATNLTHLTPQLTI